MVKKKKIGLLKRFFSPAKDKPWLIIKPFLVSCLWVILPLITVEIFKRATTFIHNGEYGGIKKWINEEEISQALNNLFKGKTVIIVAHRLQTVKSADRILLFEEGKVIEDGTHQSLIRKIGKYKKMLDLQYGF